MRLFRPAEEVEIRGDEEQDDDQGGKPGGGEAQDSGDREMVGGQMRQEPDFRGEPRFGRCGRSRRGHELVI